MMYFFGNSSIDNEYVIITNYTLVFYFCFISEIGDGWTPTTINSEAELDFIREEQKGLSNVATYWIGGRSNSTGGIEFSNYIPNQNGELNLLMFECLYFHSLIYFLIFSTKTNYLN